MHDAAGGRTWFNPRYLGTVAAVAVVYFGAAKFGLSLAFSTKQVTALWPPTGIAVAALLLGGYRVWPAIYLAAFAVNALVGDSILAAAGIAVGNTLGPVVARFSLDRLRGFDPSLGRVHDVLKLIVLGAAFGGAVSATNGVATLALSAIIPWSAYGSVWWVWWVGDAMGILVFAPLILSWAAQPRPTWDAAQRAELGTLFGGLLLASLVALAGVFVHTATPFQLQYAVFPFIIWVGLRFGARGTTLAVALVTGLAVWGAVHDRGPFVTGNLDQRLILLEMFMAVATVTGLTLSAVNAERTQAKKALQRANDELGHRVAERTAELLGRVTLLVTAEERLRESEERFRGAFEFAAIGIALVAPDGRWLQVNRSLCRMVGYTTEELLATNFQSITHPDDLEKDIGYVRQMLDGSLSHYNMEKRYFHKDGHILWIFLSVSLVRDATGRPLYFVSQIQDITGQRQLTEDLRSARADLQAILDNVPARITSWHADSTNHFVNREAATQFGVSADEAAGKHIQEIIGLARYAHAKPYIEAALAGERQSYEQVDSLSDGSLRYNHVEFVPKRPDGTVVGLYALATDVTELRESHRRLAEERERLKITLGSIHDAVITTDANTRITYINAAAESLFGLEMTAVEGRRVDAVIHLMDPQSSKAAANLIGQSAFHGKVFRREQACLLHRPDGTICYVTEVVSPVLDTTGAVSGMVIVFHDATLEIDRARDLQHRAMHDPLTGLSNRADFEQQLRAVFRKAHHLDRSAAIMAIDLDDFKALNDAAGHAAGDAMLCKVAEACRMTVRSSDIVARLGGDEFAVLLDSCTEDRAKHIGQQLLRALNALNIDWGGSHYTIGASIGLAMRTIDMADGKAWLDAADKACYTAKREGRGRLRTAVSLRGNELLAKH
jgi:diguanylate cyclase (GGDEF)-like protein/PAS domain S-box-containing protein